MRICLINPTFADLYGVRMSVCVRGCVRAWKQGDSVCVRARQGDSASACVRACETGRQCVCVRAIVGLCMAVAHLGFFLDASEALPIYVCLWNLYCTPSLKHTS